MALLEVNNITVKYAKATAIDGASLKVNEGEVVSIIGANGAGKSTLIQTISGLHRPAAGEIQFDGKRIDAVPPHDIVKMGLVQVPSGRMIVGPMTVMDNLKTGAYLVKDRRRVKQDLERMFELFPVLHEKRNQLGGLLSGGQQQMLAVARALMARPRLLMMDEPSIGLAPIIVNQVADIIRDINATGISVLLVEQNCRIALKLAQRAYVLVLGKVSLEGTAESLADDDEVRRCYLGGV